MVALKRSPRIFCTIVRVPVAEDDHMVSDNRITRRPSDRLPWSDPIIARLVAQLQDEVRTERSHDKLEARVRRAAVDRDADRRDSGSNGGTTA